VCDFFKLGAGAAAPLRTMWVAAGRSAFLEKEYEDLKYAGVTDVVPGRAGLREDPGEVVEAVQVTYDPDRISFEELMRTYWKHTQPTDAGGQFMERGPEFRSAIWAGDADERATVEDAAESLEESGVYGPGRVVTPVLDAPPASFQPLPEGEWHVLRTNPKAFGRDAKARKADFSSRWGFVQFCLDRVCGYVRFAPGCTGKCLNVFPEFSSRNSGVPELTSAVKVTGRG
jgi:peptide methionine sulfoxide reductase MsrA